MDAIRTDNYGGIPELLEAMHTGISMLESFGSMLGYTLAAGDSAPEISFGAESIIRQQCADLEFIRSALNDQFHHLRKEKLAISNIHEVARQAGVSAEKAALCVFLATGISFRNNGKLEEDPSNV